MRPPPAGWPRVACSSVNRLLLVIPNENPSLKKNTLHSSVAALKALDGTKEDCLPRVIQMPCEFHDANNFVLAKHDSNAPRTPCCPIHVRSSSDAPQMS